MTNGSFLSLTKRQISSAVFRPCVNFFTLSQHRHIFCDPPCVLGTQVVHTALMNCVSGAVSDALKTRWIQRYAVWWTVQHCCICIGLIVKTQLNCQT